MSDVPEGKPYTGPSGVARDSIWLTNEDLPHDKDTPAVIECIVRRDNVKFLKGRVKKVTLAARFKGRQRELLLNAGHRAVLSALSGSSLAGSWFGLSVLLYVEQGVKRQDGTIGPAVRIRARKGPAEGAPPPPADPLDRDFEEHAKRLE